MGIFRKKKKDASDLAPDAAFTFEHSYINAPAFRGFKRLHVTVYNQPGDPEQNANMLLNGKDQFNCTDMNITLKGFQGPDYRGISVYADNIPLGTIWDTYNEGPAFSAVQDGTISAVFLRIEAGIPHPNVKLFVQIPE